MENTNIYVIPDNGLLLNKYKRKCSFCNCEGHNVSSCNDETLVNDNRFLIHLKNNLLALYNDNRILAIIDFEKHIYHYYTRSDENSIDYSFWKKKLLRSIACRFYNIRLRSSLITTINKMILHLFDINIEWLMTHEYNFVPFNENTPIRISCIFQGILLNMANEVYNSIITNNDTIIKYEIKLETIDNDNNNNNNNDNHKEMECGICYNSFEKSNSALLECRHEYCVDCVFQFISKKQATCPYCRNNIDVISCFSQENYDKLFTITSNCSNQQSSS